MDDLQIIELYFSRAENAITETAAKYGAYLKYIAYNILKSLEDSEECTNDTYMKVWNSIPPQRPDCFKAFIGRIARNTAINLYNKYNAQKRRGSEVALDEMAECIPDRNADKNSEDKEIRESLNAFLRSLPEENRKIFVRRYWYMSSVKEIAKDYKFSESKVKMTLLRTRTALKEHFAKEGISI